MILTQKQKRTRELGRAVSRNDDSVAAQELAGDLEHVGELARLVDWDVVDTETAAPQFVDEVMELARRAQRYPGSNALERLHDKLTPRIVLQLIGQLRHVVAAQVAKKPDPIDPKFLQEREELLAVKREHERECASIKEDLEFCRSRIVELEAKLKDTTSSKTE